MPPSFGSAARRPSLAAPIALAFVALSTVAACGSGFVATSGDAPAAAPGAPGSRVDGAATGDESRHLSVPDAEAGGPAGGLALGDTVAPAEASTVADDALIVRSGVLELEVGDVAAVLAAARGAIAAFGGYVAGSEESDQGEQRWASVTYRVPVDRFDDAIDALRGLADRVVRESTASQEVTAQVVDLDARIDNLRASEAALVTIMDRAGRIDDVLAVQMRLEDVRGQIERLTAQRDELAGRAALATLTASWFTPVAAVAAAREGWDLAAEADAALAQTVAALQNVASALVWLTVVGLPLVGIPLLVAVLVVLAVRRRMAAPPRGGPSGPATVAGSGAE